MKKIKTLKKVQFKIMMIMKIQIKIILITNLVKIIFDLNYLIIYNNFTFIKL